VLFVAAGGGGGGAIGAFLPQPAMNNADSSMNDKLARSGLNRDGA
jgi:hypothetical protein